MKISEIREKVAKYGRQREETDGHGEYASCDACGEMTPIVDELYFQLEEDVFVCGWCLSDVEYDVIPPVCQGCGKKRNMTRVNEIQPGVYFCWECLRTVWT